MSVRNCAAIHNDARWRAECWAPVRQRLIELGHETERILFDLNSGGCGLFAAMVGERLLKLGYRARLVISGSPRAGMPSLNFMGRRGKLGVHWVTHVLLRVYGEVYDSRGFAPFTDRDPTFGDQFYKGSVSIPFGLDLARQRGAWSRVFDWRRGEPIIQRLIDKYLPLEERA